MQKPTFLLVLLALAGAAVAQPAAPLPHPDVPAALDVAGLHLVLNEEARRLVQQKADALCRHQPSFQARVDLADGAFPIIDKALQQEGVPLDFRYLALQESALRGDAESIHGAVGYWQLKRETATDLGLTVNNAVDERKHLTASTHAAARYLSRNNASLRNWLNALLSYNTGPTGVKAYVLPTDVGATQMNITEDTSPYVLMFLAQKIAFEPACGMNARPPLQLREFPAVPGQSLAEQAQTIYADPAALAVHNRWLLAGTVPADKPYTLIVPVTDAAQAAGLVANQRLGAGRELISAPELSRKNSREVRVNNLRALIALPGETKEELAKRGKIRLRNFLHDNELTGFDTVVPGRPYFLESKRDAAAVEYHVVQTGETVADIAQKYGVRRKAILVKNRLASNGELRPGRVLWLQHTRPREVAVEYRSTAEGIGLELPVGSPRRATAPAPAPRPVATAPAKATPPASRVIAQPSNDLGDDIDEATEALNARRPAAPVVVAPPARRAPASLPPPAPLPTMDAPLDDEPTPANVPTPVENLPVALPASVPVRPSGVARPTTVAPGPAVVAKPVVPAVATVQTAVPTGGQHLVQPGETVYGLARQYGLRPADLLAWNGLAPNAGLSVGQVLQLKPGGAANIITPAAVEGAATVHTVTTGETLYSISKRYNVTVNDLQAWNKKADTSVRIGEVLQVTAK